MSLPPEEDLPIVGGDQIVIPVEADVEDLTATDEHGNAVDVQQDENLGDEVKLENYDSENVTDNNQRRFQNTTSQDDYELVSPDSKPSSTYLDQDKTPTPPPEISIPILPSPSPPASPIPDVSSTTIVVEPAEPSSSIPPPPVEEPKTLQPATQSFWQYIVNALNAVVEWVRWLFGQ